MFSEVRELICKLKYSGNTTVDFKYLQTCHPHMYYGYTKKPSQASHEEKAKLSVSGSSYQHNKQITDIITNFTVFSVNTQYLKYVVIPK